MAYLPKSKIKKQETPGGEFITKFNKRNYIGPYIESSDGTFYAGHDSTNLSQEIIRPPRIYNNFGDSEDVRKYKNLKPNPYEKLAKTKQVIGSRPKPTKEDYEKGFFVRYYIKRTNSESQYTEIDTETFTAISNKDATYDHNLYDYGAIKWALQGNTEKINKLLIEKEKKLFPNLHILFPILNEFKKSDEEIIDTPIPGFTYNYPSSGGSSGGGGGGY